MEARRPQVLDLGLFLLVVALPLIFTPFSRSPFGDPKVVVAAAAALALFASGLPVDRPLAWTAGAWVAITVAASLAGVDPSKSLTAQTTGEGGGAMVVLACAAVLLAGVALEEDARDRARRWFVVACLVVGALGIATRLFPGTFGTIGMLSFVGATMGNQLFAGALLAAAIPAAMGDRNQSLSRQLPILAVLALAIATFGERSAIVLPVVAIVAFVLKARIPARRWIAGAVCVGAVLLAWQVVSDHIATGGRGASLTIASQATDQERFTVWRVLATRAVADRPVLGWGPGTTQSAYLANATRAEVQDTTRAWQDAHDLPLETLVTTGPLGLAALLLLGALLAARGARCPPERAWAFAAAATLAAYALIEPINLVLTPLLFFFAGIAAGPPRLPTAEPRLIPGIGWSGTPERRPAGRIAAAVATLVLAAGLVVSAMMLAGATFERWGRAYGEEWAYRDALRIQPWRLTSTEALALQLAVDGRSGDRAAGSEARSMIDAAVGAHPWDPDVRFYAFAVARLGNDEAAARARQAQQAARFPGDGKSFTDATSATGLNVPPNA